uniref:Homeodomain-like protein n=1 Tax=Tanacetum cinerariifolium TaxID=118510 RepID=A0A6L2JWW2_TANCI|nr:homeodomain-like protein [Tanacetum cinerariifolium]
MKEINNFQQEPDEILYQAWERFKELLMKFPQHYLTKMQEVVLFYNGLEVLTRHLDSIHTKTAADAKKGSYGMQYLNAYSYGATRIDDSLPQKEKDPGSFTLPCYVNNVCFENNLADLRASISVVPLSIHLNLGFKLVHANFFPNFPINVMSKKFYNSIMKDKVEFRGRNELGNFGNVPFFIGNFYVITDSIVVEDMDPYLDGGMEEVVVVEPFCEVLCVETKRFDGIITIHDEDDYVTYQMVRSNPRFKHLTNEQCNKIPPLLKVSKQDKKNGISYPNQKLKGFYKGVLNLEPDFIRDSKIEEWLTRGHISVHKME